MRVLPLAVLTLFVSPIVFAARTIHTATALAPATMEELARVRVTPIAGERREHRERPPTRPAIASMENAIAATMIVAPTAAPPPPAVTRGFQAVTHHPLPGPTVDPADAAGAVGPQHVVGVFNNTITIHDRTGNLLSLVSETQFWHDSSQRDLILYDPRVAYDAANDRWVIIILGFDILGNGPENGVLYVAISTSGNPAAGWRRFRVPVDQPSRGWFDVTHLALTADQIVITAGVLAGDDYLNSTVFTTSKSAAFTGPNLSLAGHTFEPTYDLLPLSSDDTTLRLVEYLDDTSIRTFELLSSGATQRSIVWTATVSYGPPGPCAQLGSSVEPQCGGILLSGIARNGTMWIVQETFSLAPLVWKIKPGAGAATAYVIQDSARAIVFPSIAVNRRGTALVGYVLMSSSIYLSAWYSTIDPAGNISAPALLKSGEAPEPSADRWGDYTTTVVDPVDDMSFWTLGLYANALPNTKIAGWATWWGYIKTVDSPTRNRAVRH